MQHIIVMTGLRGQRYPCRVKPHRAEWNPLKNRVLQNLVPRVQTRLILIVGVSGIFVQPATLTTNDFQVSFHDLFFPVLPLTLLNNNYTFYPDTGPPGINLKVSSVRLDHICEFRI